MTYPSGVTIARMVAAAAAAALVLSPVASASIWPAPGPLKPHTTLAVHGLVLTGSRRHHVTTRSCNAHAQAAWWFTPVACEQPPKSQLLVPLLGG